MSSDFVNYDYRDSAIILTINRPDKRNALSRDLISALHTSFERAGADDQGRCVILTGAGSAFCAGMDLDELRGVIGAEKAVLRDDARRLSDLYELIFNLPKPTIAAVNGPALAGGAGLMTICDFAIAVKTATFGYPEVKRGLVAAMVMPHLLRQVGERLAKYLLMTGELINAQKAEEAGLLNEIVEAEELMPAALRWSKLLCQSAPKAFAATKDLIARTSQAPLSPEAYAEASAEPRSGEECRDGLNAFFNKQPAPWNQRQG